MKLKINLTKKLRTNGAVACKGVSIRERLLRFLFGDLNKVTVLIPGDNVGEILICKFGENLKQRLMQISEELRQLAESLEVTTEEVPQEPAPEITLEEIRGVLADISRAGFTADVKKLIVKYGAERLSDVDPNNYSSLLNDAKELMNA